MRSEATIVCLSISALMLMVAGEYIADDWALTRYKTVRAKYLWSLANYSLLPIEIEDSVSSPKFQIGDPYNLKWQMWMTKYLDNSTNEYYFNIFIWYSSQEVADLRADYNISFMNSSYSALNNLVSTEGRIKAGRGYGFAKAIQEKDFKNKEWMSDDKLLIYAEIRAYISIDDFKADELPDDSEYADHLEAYVDNEEYSDLVLSVEEYNLPAHRVILSAHSPVFAAILPVESYLKIDDAEVDVVREALRWMYTGRVEKFNSLATKLLAFASDYQIEGLKNVTEKRLCQIMDTDNVIDILNVSGDLLNAKARSFVATNGDKFLEMPEFKALQGFRTFKTVTV